MKDNSKISIRFNTLLALSLIILGLAVNQWSLAHLYPPNDNSINPKNKIVVWSFQVFCIISGLLVY